MLTWLQKNHSFKSSKHTNCPKSVHSTPKSWKYTSLQNHAQQIQHELQHTREYGCSWIFLQINYEIYPKMSTKAFAFSHNCDLHNNQGHVNQPQKVGSSNVYQNSKCEGNWSSNIQTQANNFLVVEKTHLSRVLWIVRWDKMWMISLSGQQVSTANWIPSKLIEKIFWGSQERERERERGGGGEGEWDPHTHTHTYVRLPMRSQTHRNLKLAM